MKLIGNVSADKIRGGYYTSDRLVDWTLRRVVKLAGGMPGAWLEPSAGDGAFLRGLDRLQRGERNANGRVTAIELLAEEAAKCSAVMAAARIEGDVIHGSFFDWASESDELFDALVGNPPYVRYQFVNAADRAHAERLMRELGLELKGVSNLWIPFALAGMYKLKPSAPFALVLPSELFSTVSGGQFRQMLVRDFASLRLDLFPRDAFPDILQDVVVVSGVRAKQSRERRQITFCEHHAAEEVAWKHTVEASPQSWLRHLLTEAEVAAFEEACHLTDVCSMSAVARIEVSIVTGANPFFTIDDATREKYALHAWTRPLLARTADCPGLTFTEPDHDQARQQGSRAWILDFSAERPDPTKHVQARAYLAGGEAERLQDRFKCRIREPWYRVPQIRSGRLLLSKRAHLYHRLILNNADVFTTDTIYRGQMLPHFADRAEDLVAGFQNSLTLLSSEIEGRTYGGGVLELVPSEAARLRVPLVRMVNLLPRLDQLSRTHGGQKDASGAILETTDAALAKQLPGYANLLPLLRSARQRLHDRRMATQQLRTKN
ncbi:Eco57I restriction-modification methylase domain-containing protein [Lignipirellula cremea]|uniref:site-specific DNA-methyltransferase (adenine-specific) n=1 Tax=Lignipirellula cremea TaxID=2528010 RepID=A0A518DZW2_9BACT|nr:SAM-dependent methyltransferase [Lignipirellula cremea]QDU97377.1 Modification methylase Eco57IB [Lignipirellula cremea]